MIQDKTHLFLKYYQTFSSTLSHDTEPLFVFYSLIIIRTNDPVNSYSNECLHSIVSSVKLYLIKPMCEVID